VVNSLTGVAIDRRGPKSQDGSGVIELVTIEEWIARFENASRRPTETGRSQFITEPNEVPKPEDDPIEPGEVHVFTLNDSTAGGWESWAKENDLHPKDLLVFFNFLCFGDGTGLRGTNGQPFNLKGEK